MLQAFARVKPVSVGKLYAVYVGLVVFIMGLAADFVVLVLGRGSLAITFDSMMGNTPMQQELMLNPWQILLMTCLLTLLVMVLGFFYGVILALLYNLAANITGGVVVDTVAVGPVVKQPVIVSQKTVTAPVVTHTAPKVTKPVAAVRKSVARKPVARTPARKKRKA